jgi:hypothetical protein
MSDLSLLKPQINLNDLVFDIRTLDIRTYKRHKIILKCCILFLVPTNKNGGVTVTQTNVFIFINSQHVSAQIGHHQGILDEFSHRNFIITATY